MSYSGVLLQKHGDVLHRRVSTLTAADHLLSKDVKQDKNITANKIRSMVASAGQAIASLFQPVGTPALAYNA